jgi:uncharacterized repeat protein (TIGR03803 family)
LSPKTGGGWTEKILHSFGAITKDGTGPSDRLLLDGSGNLYGTTRSGGAHGAGTAFKLSPKTGGGWAEKVLHSFGGFRDGGTPDAGLVSDASGNLYGTTSTGGAQGGSYGTVFELMPKLGGGWTEQILHSFVPDRGDGAYPGAGLIFDTAGNLYSTTASGGVYGYGTVFELTPQAGGGWTETILHSFPLNQSNDGFSPGTGLTFDAIGNICGTTSVGGSGTCLADEFFTGCGTVFELARQAGWTESVLYSFNNNGSDGTYPSSGLIFDAAGNLYAATSYGGNGRCLLASYAGCGTVFELIHQGGGNWTETVLHSFNGRDGYRPGDLIFDGAGNLYGTTSFGGATGTACSGEGCGTVMRSRPRLDRIL